jgi:hypothetical protein
MTETVKTAVITGGHSFEVLKFHELFRSLPGVDAYIQHLDDFASSAQAVRDSYDALCFYFFLREGPTDEGQPWWAGKPKAALERIGQTEQGVVVLHHALLAYPDWPLWIHLVGIQDRDFDYYHDEQVNVYPTAVEHPITEGLSAWTMIDETYDMADAGEGSEVLLTTDHPKSMTTIAWTRTFGQARVFCNELGHDGQAWKHPSFRMVLGRGIHWAARRL